MMSTEAIFHEPIDPPEEGEAIYLSPIQFDRLVAALRRAQTVYVELDEYGHGHIVVHDIHFAVAP